MIIALWGSSATAKTTIAKLLASKLGTPLRSCGEEIRNAATEAHVSLADAPDSLHRQVDAETCDWVVRETARGAILEGRFLDQVLAGQPDVILVQAVSEPIIRFERWVERVNAEFDRNDLVKIDEADDLFRARMYGSVRRGTAHFTLDTSRGKADEWADKLLGLIQEGATAPRG